MVDRKNDILIDIITAIKNPHNKGLGESFQELIIDCLSLMYSNNHKITSYSNSSLNVERITSYPIKLEKLNPDITGLGIQEHIVIEYAAICANIVLLPFIHPYQAINTLKRKDGADYICEGKKRHFVLESKGDTTKYNYKTRIKRGEEQVRISFKKIKNKKVLYGLVGLSRFIKEHHYFVKFEKREKDQKKVSEMENPAINDTKSVERNIELEKLKENSSQLITDAMALEVRGKLNESKKLYQLAFDKIIQIASNLEESESLEAIDYWFSAINCAIAAEDFPRAMLVMKDLGENLGLTEYDLKELEKLKREAYAKIKIKKSSEIPGSFFTKILNWILFKLEEVHGNIRGKGVVMKICLDLRLIFLQYGYYLPIRFRVNRNPVYSTEINEMLVIYSKSGFIIQGDKDIVLSPKAKMKVSKEKSNTEYIIKTKFSEDFFTKIEDLIEFLGNKSSKELIAIEKEAGITAYQYGRPIINEGIKIGK